MKWFKENWFKSGILFAFFVLILVNIFFILDQLNRPNTNTNIKQILEPNESLKKSFDETLQSDRFTHTPKLSCFPTSQYNCDEYGCVATIPSGYYFVDYETATGTYYKCSENGGCDSYPVNIAYFLDNAQFTSSLERKSESVLFRVTGKDILVRPSSFINVSAFGGDVMMSYGKCNCIGNCK